MDTLNRAKILAKLKRDQANIIPESDEDEGAAEFYGELQSVIDVIESGAPDSEILEAANYVGATLSQ